MTSTRAPRTLLSLAAVVAAGLALGSPPRAVADEPTPFADWKEVKKHGVAQAKEHAEKWTTEGKAVGKDLLWVALMWHRGEEWDKAREMLEAYLKVPEMKPENREVAYDKLMDIAEKTKAWPKVVEIATKYREEFQGGKLLPESWDLQGRALRMSGDEEKAMAAFSSAAELKFNSGMIDLVDVHMAAGRIAEAKAAAAKYLEGEIKGKEVILVPFASFLDVIGSEAPEMKDAKSVGKSAAPESWKGKPAAFLHWTMQTPNGDRRLQRFEGLHRQWGDKVNFAGLSTYKKYNPQTSKVDPDMGEEQERDWFQQFISSSKFVFPPCIVVPAELHEGLKQKFEGQMTVVDAEGKFRYMRINDMKSYDLECVNFALKKLVGSGPSTAGTDEPAPGGEPGMGAAPPPGGEPEGLPPIDK
jgi:hypothetical protein